MCKLLGSIVRHDETRSVNRKRIAKYGRVKKAAN